MKLITLFLLIIVVSSILTRKVRKDDKLNPKTVKPSVPTSNVENNNVLGQMVKEFIYKLTFKKDLPFFETCSNDSTLKNWQHKGLQEEKNNEMAKQLDLQFAMTFKRVDLYMNSLTI